MYGIANVVVEEENICFCTGNDQTEKKNQMYITADTVLTDYYHYFEQIKMLQLLLGTIICYDSKILINLNN